MDAHIRVYISIFKTLVEAVQAFEARRGVQRTRNVFMRQLESGVRRRE